MLQILVQYKQQYVDCNKMSYVILISRKLKYF